MKNKNTVVALLIVFTLICGYNLFWTYEQFRIDGVKEKHDLALTIPEDSRSEADSSDIRAWTGLQSDPDFSDHYKKAIESSFTLGLDLQGGMFVTLEIGVDDIIRQLAGNPQDSLFQSAITCAREQQAEVAQAYVPLFVQCFEDINPNGSLGAIFANPDLEINVGSSNAEVQEILAKEADDAIDRAFEIIRARIDQFGVVSPNLQKQESTGRILLELPGVKEPERVRKLLRSTAKLEFYTTHTWADGIRALVDVNERLRVMYGLVDTTATDSAVSDTEGVASDDTLADAGTASEDTTSSVDSILSASDVINDSITDPSEMSEEELEREREKFKRENPLFALLSLMNTQALQQTGSTTPLVGVALPTDTAKINDILQMEEITPLIPQDMKFVWGFKPQEGSEYIEMIAIRVNDDGIPDLGGEAVSTARQDFDPNNASRSLVSMNMTPEGTKEWGRITEANVGRHVAILLDGYHYSYPVVNEPILTGRSQISGGFTVEEAKDLANVLKAGQLPVPAKIAGEETVGPTLGEQNIRDGMLAFFSAFVLTLIFMAIYYAKSGIVANLALLANLVFILGCSAAFTIVLTLPGIAAVVLTVGMAVDANVLIFERIREEMIRDKTVKASIKSGFANAFSSVMDANITTFLTGVVLYAFGVGPIRGFAVSLMIGIITSLISALVITRLILDYYGSRGGKSINFGFDWSLNIFRGIKLDMVHKRKTFYAISGAVFLASLILFTTVGLKTGVDFKGGRQFKVAFKDASTQVDKNLSSQDVEQIRKDLTAAFNNNAPIIKTVKSPNQIMVTSSYLVDNREATDSVQNIMMNGLAQNFGSSNGFNAEVISTSDVGPTVANDIRTAAYLSVVFSLMIIFLYILIRFRKWQYSLGAIVAVFHDVVIVLGVFSLLSLFDLPFSVEVDQALIAALLTIIGYSINDTVVVFDRIRENIGEMKASKLDFIYNQSIDQTISRTLITSLTTFLTATILFFFGGDVIRGFVFAIMIGILIGTYSSIFVASPISLDLINRLTPAKEKA